MLARPTAPRKRSLIEQPSTDSVRPLKKHASETTEAGKSSTSAADTTDVTNNVPAAPVIIAHCRKVQRMMDSKRIPWGTQFEIARGVTQGHWTWDDVHNRKLDKLCAEDRRNNSNKEASPRVAKVLKPSGRQIKGWAADLQLWEELDREEAAIIENIGRGLGLQGDWHGQQKWYGGKVEQYAHLSLSPSKELKITLHAMKLRRRSHRFARFVGSRRILQVKIAQDLLNNSKLDIATYMKNKFILCGRCFVCFLFKDHKAYLLETNEDYERIPLANEHRISLHDFIMWHNPPSLNAHQPVAKWITRFDLGLSNSVPALEFDVSNIEFIRDEEAPHPSSQKIPPEKILTDGCGFINGRALSLIAQHFGYAERPTALQGRIMGSKGVWLLHPEHNSNDTSEPPRLWIRDSQRKIRLPPNPPRAHLIFDLVAPPRLLTPCRLSRSTIVLLSHNGVCDAIFEQLLEDGLKLKINALTNWNGPEAMFLLWDTINKIGSVSRSKIEQFAAGSARAYGLSGRDWDREGFEEEDDEDHEPGPSASIYSSTMELLQAGFHPLTLRTLYDKIRTIIEIVSEAYTKEYRIEIAQSAEAFIVPDPYGVLEERQIHFRASHHCLKDPLTNTSPNVLQGDVLIYRNPVRLPSDIQKVTAVAHPKLAEYTDVIVLPTTGPYSFASYLAGGDYDGDTCVCIYDPIIVSAFSSRSQTPCFPEEGFIEKNFEAFNTIDTVAALVKRLSPGDSSCELQKSMLSGGISEPKIALYSRFHDYAAYTFGLDDPKTVRLAHMFNHVLDSRKSGLRVKGERLQADTKEFSGQLPACMRPVDDKSEVRPAVRKQSKPFILDQLLRAGRRLEDKLLQDYEALGSGVEAKLGRDPDLLMLYTSVRDLGQEDVNIELKRLGEHIDAHIDKWGDIAAKSSCSRTESFVGALGRSKSGPARKNTGYDEVARSFRDLPAELRIMSAFGSAHRIAASYAYSKNPKFAFAVAFEELCDMKARVRGSATITRKFQDMMAMPPSVRRLLTHLYPLEEGAGGV